jgi:copper chaperone CopZ
MIKLVLAAAFTLGAASGRAQVMPRPVKVDINTPEAVCDPCKVKIEATVPKYVDGIVKITVYPKRKITQVTYYPDRTNIEEIKTAISNCGFDANEVLANPDVYKKLPDCCKKAEDQKQPATPK